MLADRYGTSEQPVWKWRKRDIAHDLTHTLLRIQAAFSRAQEDMAVTLQTALLHPLDDLLAIVREFFEPRCFAVLSP